MASQTVLLGNRTTTWDRPPLASEALSRTATLLESARVTQSAILPLTGARADSAGLVSGHPPAQVPPTTLQELRPLQTAPLVRLGTWSEAPQAHIVPAWRPHQASGDPKLATGLTACGTAVPVSAVRLAPTLQRASTSGPTVVLPLQRAATTGPPAVAMPVAPAPVQLQRSGTLTLDMRSQPSVRGVTLQRAPSLVVQSSPVAVQMQVVPCQLGAAVRPVQVTRVAAKAPLSQEQVPEIGRLLLQSAFAVKEQKPKQLRLVVAGLMGSGKSTICRMLRHLFEGCWINQDEFSHLGKGAKKAFLAAIEKAAADETLPVLLVDKINTMKQHREEIVNAMNRGKPGNLVFIQVKHPADGDRWDQTLRLCESRIAKRGEGHHTLKASPQLRGILQRTVNSAEAMDKDELSKFRGVLKVDMTQSSIVQIMKLLSDLEDLDVFGMDIEVDQLMGEERLLQALHAAKKVESDLAEAGKSKEKPAKPAATAPWYWALQLEQGSSEKLLQAWEGSEDHVTASASGIESKSEHHVTMLYLGGGKDEEVAARNPRLSGPQQVAKLKEEFKQRQGEALSLEVPRIVWEEGRIAAAAVVLPDQLRQLCANDFPHITIGLAPRVNAVVSNELLARRAATEDLQTGLQAWLRQLSLQQYGPQLARWCQQMGAATPDELAEFAADAAQAVEADQESQERVAQALQKAVQRPIHELMFDSPLQLTALLQGVGRGQ